MAVLGGAQIISSQAGGGSGGAGRSGALPEFGNYTLYISGGTTYARNNLIGAIDSSNADAAVVINAAIANMPNGGTLFFKNGIYNLNSLVQESTGGFSHYYAIAIPGGGPSQYAEWHFIGESKPPVIDQFGNPVQTSGVIFYVTPTAVATVASTVQIMCIWARPDVTHGIGATVFMENINVRFPDNQRGSETGIDLTQALLDRLKNVVADTNVAQPSLSFPVAGTHGLVGITSTYNSKEDNHFELVYVTGYDVGIDIQSEHTSLDTVFALNCNHGIDYGVRSNGTITAPSSWKLVGVAACARGLTLGAHVGIGTLLDISGLSFEDAASGAFVPVYHAKETNSGNTFGKITYTASLEGTGVSVLANCFDGGGGISFSTSNPNNIVLQPRISKPTTFSTLPAASSANEGCLAFVTDSTTATWGATITGSGTNHVLAYSDGSNWTVAGI